jgi:2-oxoglutarate ferredoxin oxidoreductase subunit beta
VLREAAQHKGTALVEIYQNCNIFNDGAFEPLKDANVRDDITIRLEHGQPIVFGAQSQKALIRSAMGAFEVVATADVDPSQIVVHDAANPDPSQAFALSRLDSPTFEHTPIGIFRNFVRPSYDEQLRDQLDEAIDHQGPGDLASLLSSGDTWRID